MSEETFLLPQMETDPLHNVIEVFRNVIGNILRTNATRIRRVIFSRNNDGMLFYF